jgi:hypothetical protein
MAINIKTLKGTNSISADRITINDNFKINTDATNNLLAVVNTTTGKINNTGIGADNTITTEGITITTSGLDIQNGNLSLSLGNIVLATDGAYIELGTDNSRLTDNIIAIGASGPNSNHYLELENFIGVSMPRLTTVEINNITGVGTTGPNLITFDSDTDQFKGWNGTSWSILG